MNRARRRRRLEIDGEALREVPARVAIVADAHIGGPGGDPEQLVEQLRSLPGHCDRLILLGDLFHIWVGFPQYETAEVALVLEAIAEVRRAGVRVDYIEGNRDFFIAEGPYAAHFDWVGDDLEFENAGCRVVAVHGDGLNDRDWAYRFWSGLSKSVAVRFLVRRLPARFAMWMMEDTERRLAKTNFKHKKSVPEGPIRRFVERRLGARPGVVLLGHFHRERRIPCAVGAAAILDAWFRSRRVEWLGSGGAS